MRTLEEIKAEIEHAKKRKRTFKLSDDEREFAAEHGLVKKGVKVARIYNPEYQRSHADLVDAISRARRNGKKPRLTDTERRYAIESGILKTAGMLTDRQRRMIEESHEWISRIVQKRKSSVVDYVEYCDLYQVAMLSVCSSATTYTPDKNATFRTYAGNRANFAITDYLRDQGWGHKRWDNLSNVTYELTSIDIPVTETGLMPDEVGAGGLKSPCFDSEVEFNIDLESATSDYSAMNARIVQMLARGETIHDIAKEIGMTPIAARAYVNRLIERRREELIEVCA